MQSLFVCNKKIQGVISFAPFAFRAFCAWMIISERIPFALTFGFAPSASETANNTVATSAWLATNHAIAIDIITFIMFPNLFINQNSYIFLWFFDSL